MKTMKSAAIFFIVAIISVISLGTGITYGAGDIASVVALKGNALIERDARAIEAKLKDGIQLKDIVVTKESSKAKMLFIDDSVLTMGEKSKVVIKEFIYSKDQKGRSIFNLIDGKMRSVVGKSEFEIHTPTAVAAARGTVFDCETGQKSGQSFTTCTSYEGVVDIRSIDPTITGRVTLRPGMTVTVISGQPISAPTPAPTTTTLQSGGTSSTTPAPSLPLIQAPPIVQQPPAVQPPPPPPPTTTPVNVGIGFPTLPPPTPTTGGIHVGW